jgi:riboflavin transporter FmnP
MSKALLTQSVPIPRSRKITAVGLFGALSILLSLISAYILRLAFVPPTTYLLFDLGEIPVIICFMTFGPKAGFSAAVIELIALNILPTTLPILGPLFKFFSVSTTILGLWVGLELFKKWSDSSRLVGSGLLAIIFRVTIMTILNAPLLIVVFGVPAGNTLYFFLILTAIFNALHVPFDLIPSFYIVRFPSVRRALRSSGMIWFESRVK